MQTDPFSMAALALHWGAFALAAAFWPVRRLRPSLAGALLVAGGVLAVPFVLSGLLLLNQENQAGQGTYGMWYAIYGVVTLGIVPAAFVAAHAHLGRLTGWWARRGRRAAS